MPSSAAASAPVSGTGLDAFLAFDSKTDQRADLAAKLDRFILGQVAEVGDLDLSLGILVHRQCVDHPHRVALTQPFELRDHLAVKIGMGKAQDKQLYWSNRHVSPSFVR